MNGNESGTKEMDNSSDDIGRLVIQINDENQIIIGNFMSIRLNKIINSGFGGGIARVELAIHAPKALKIIRKDFNDETISTVRRKV